jgi:hypothetical protein
MTIELFSVSSEWGEGNSDAGFYPLKGTQAQEGFHLISFYTLLLQ